MMAARYQVAGSFWRGWCACTGVVALLGSASVCAQALRDPTQPPAAVAALQAGGATVSANDLLAGAVSVVVRQGQPRLLVGSRLYAPGQMVGSTRVERITETEIWLSSGGQVHKIARYAGVQRQAVSTASGARCAPAKPAASASAKSGANKSLNQPCDPAKS